MEDPTHLGTLASQFVVLGNGLLRLQDFDVDASLLHKVQSGRRNLRKQTTAQMDLDHISIGDVSVSQLCLMEDGKRSYSKQSVCTGAVTAQCLFSGQQTYTP